MAQQLINLGTPPGGVDGDTVRSGFNKANLNFSELYTATNGKQPASTKLTTLAAAVWAANSLQYQTGADTVANTPLTAFARTILDDADAPAVRTTIGAQASSANLTSLAGLTLAADQMLLATGSGTLATFATTAYGRGLLALANPAAAQAAIGGSTVGRALFTAASEAAARTTLQLGTGATLDVTTTAFDATANRLTKVGDFGIGTLSGLVATSAQLDGTALGGGAYRCDLSSPWRGLPAGVYGILHNPLNNANASMQVAVNYLTGTLYARGRYQDNFREHYNTGNAVGTVAQAGGAPTGAIIERGSNGNGEYTRYADGTQDCWWENDTSSICNGGVYGNLMYGAYVTRNYPMPFVAGSVPALAPFCRYVNPTEGGVAMLGLATAQRGSNTGVVLQPQGGSATAGGRMGYIAKGRWF